MQGQTAIVLGATGLIGSNLVQLLLNDNTYAEVRILVRSPVSFSHPKLSVKLVSFDDYHDLKEKLGPGHSVFCCVGTTLKKVKGDRHAYRKVDYDIPVNSANAAIENGCKQYLLISSVGANAQSRNFYLQLKGSVEEAISRLPFESIHFFRPSLLLGDRREFRAGERIGQGAMTLLSFLFVGPLKKYKAIQAIQVAKAMVAVAKKKPAGVHFHEYNEISQFAQSYLSIVG